MLYFAHAIFYLKTCSKQEDGLLAQEKVFLIDEKNKCRLNDVAITTAQNKEALESMRYSWIFMGVRKIIRCANSEIKIPNNPSGMEITSSIFRVKSMENILKLANGEMVELEYLDDEEFPEC